VSSGRLSAEMASSTSRRACGVTMTWATQASLSSGVRDGDDFDVGRQVPAD
jgi:hypothetical protein